MPHHGRPPGARPRVLPRPAAAAAATQADADALRARADVKIARDASWAVGWRPMLLEIRGLKREERAVAYAKVIAEIEKP